MYRKNFPCCTADEWGGMEANIQFFVSIWPIGSASAEQNHQESVQCRRVQMWAEVTPLSPCLNPAVDSPATRFITFLFTRFYSQTKLPLIQSLLSQYAPLSLRPLTCEVKAGHRWGPREQGCIQFQHARAKRGFFFFFGHEFTLGEVPPVIVPFITTRRLSDATMSRWHLRYVPDVIGMHQVGPGDGRPSSCSADSLRGPILLAGFVLSPSPGPNRKTAKGRDPALYISFNEVTSSPRWCFCTSKLPLFLVCASIKIYVSQHLIFAHWSPGHEAEVMNIKQQKACGSYPSRRPLLHFFLFTTASK